jgi:hypothetical protein
LSTAAGDGVEAPSIFAAHIRYVLDREFERADRSTRRAETLFKSQVAILTVAVGLIAFVYRDGHSIALDVNTVQLFAGAAAMAVIAMLAAAFGQSIAVKSSLTDDPTLNEMLSSERWPSDPNALYVTACRDRDSVGELRQSNTKRARVTDVALWFQVGSVVLAVAAVVHEVARHIDWI